MSRYGKPPIVPFVHLECTHRVAIRGLAVNRYSRTRARARALVSVRPIAILSWILLRDENLCPFGRTQ